jgi:hypothetical protein
LAKYPTTKLLNPLPFIFSVRLLVIRERKDTPTMSGMLLMKFKLNKLWLFLFVWHFWRDNNLLNQDSSRIPDIETQYLLLEEKDNDYG